MTAVNLTALARDIGCESLTPLPRDVSPRQYYRGRQKGRSVVVMTYPLNPESGAELRQFIRLARWLAQKGIKTPAIYAEDMTNNRAVIEDLGDTSFGKALKKGADRTELYTLAADVLRHLRGAGIPENLEPFEHSRIRRNVRQLPDYYVAFTRGQTTPEPLTKDFLEIWNQIEKGLPPCPRGFLHGDYHLENLMLLEKGEGLARCALIDFQDALEGPIPYDLVNLLEDARMDVPDDLSQTLIARYCEGMSAQEEEVFRVWYRVLGTQFHCRVIGLFVKLAAEQSRDEYLIHISRLQNYIKMGVEHPALAPLKGWLAKEGVDFAPIKDLNGAEIREKFRMMDKK